MSFVIHWEKLDKKVAQSVQQQLNSFFAKLEQKPKFLGEISVESLDFGSVPPYFEILDLTEPYPEFYMATEEDESNATPAPSLQQSSDGQQKGQQLDDYSGVDDDVRSVLSMLPDRPMSSASAANFLNTRMPMPGSGAMTPVPRIWNHQPIYPGQTPSRLGAPVQRLSFSGYGNGAGSVASHELHEVAVERTEDDMQLLLRVEYCGDMSLVLKTELQLNYPATQFASLPVTLHITKIEFKALAVIAYMKDRINFCFLEPEPPQTSLLDSFSIRTEIGDEHRQVLKNVEKLELFITEQLRKAIDDDFVFPCYHSFEIASNT
ncbi:Mitochondrial distribution and morphology protein 12 [Dipsacomyces acuminosporus]|nr:Mitochondrial distribution and morphology protein 12 [Dipsacomyces acuminosporus]